MKTKAGCLSCISKTLEDAKQRNTFQAAIRTTSLYLEGFPEFAAKDPCDFAKEHL